MFAPGRRILPALAVVVLALLGLAAAGPASAHSELKSSSPASGAILKEVPTEVTLIFNEKVQEGFSQVAVVDGEGLSVTDGDPVSEGATVTQALAGELHPGSYVINYKVVSADGHPISNAIPFTIAEGATDASGPARDTASSADASSATDAATSSSNPSGTDSASPSTPSSAQSATGAGTSTTSAASSGEQSGGGPATALLVILGVLVLAGAMGAGAMLRARGPRA